MKASNWITTVFSDPAQQVFGVRVSASRRLRAADQFTPGEYGGVDAVLEQIRSIDIPTSVGEDYVIDLLIWSGGQLNSIISSYPTSVDLQPVKRYILNWLKNYFSTWKTAGTAMDSSARATGYAAQPTNWLDPNLTPINKLEGPGKIEMIKEALGQLLWYAVAAFASPNAPKLEPDWLLQRNMPFPTDKTGAGAAAGVGLTMPDNLNLQSLPANPYLGGVGSTSQTPGEVFIRSLGMIMEERNDVKWLVYEITVWLGDSSAVANQKVRAFIATYGESATFSTWAEKGVMTMDPAELQKYRTTLSGLVKTAFGFTWMPE